MIKGVLGESLDNNIQIGPRSGVGSYSRTFTQFLNAPDGHYLKGLTTFHLHLSGTGKLGHRRHLCACSGPQGARDVFRMHRGLHPTVLQTKWSSCPSNQSRLIIAERQPENCVLAFFSGSPVSLPYRTVCYCAGEQALQSGWTWGRVLAPPLTEGPWLSDRISLSFIFLTGNSWDIKLPAQDY